MAYSPFPPAYVAPGDGIPGNCIVVAGTDGTDARSLLVSTTGQLHTIIDSSASIAVTGTFYPATQPVSGTVAVTNAGLTALTFDGSSYLEVNVKAMPTVAVTGTFYQATQPVSGTVAVTNAGLTALASSIQAPGSAIPADVVMAGGSDGTDSRALLTDASGRLIITHRNNILLATTAISVTSTVTSESETAGLDGQCVVVSVSCVTAKTMAYPVAVRVRDTTNGITTAWQLSPIQVANGSATQLYFNLPVTNGDTVVIDIIAQNTVGSGATNVAAVLSPLSIPTSLRSDGRSLPLGTQSVQQTSSGTVVAAVAGWRPMIHGITLSNSATAAQTWSYSGYVGGTNITYCELVTAAGQAVVAVYPQGLMGDVNQPISANLSGTSIGTLGVCFYDMVPA